MRKTWLSVPIVISVLFLTGCVTVQPSGYLDNYDGLKSSAGLKKVSRDSALSFAEKKTLFVETPQLDMSGLKLTEIEAKGYAKQFANKLAAKLSDSGLFLSVANSAEGATYNNESYVFKSQISRLNPGNGFVRWFWGMGAGMSDVQIEGKLIDKTSNQAVMQFADRRRESGNPLFGFNIGSLNNDKQINRSMDNIVKSLTKYLGKV
jgi:hypothetical protein